jgi:hypothetical protein
MARSEPRRSRVSSLATVVGVLVLTTVLESTIAFSLTYGAFRAAGLALYQNAWLSLRVVSVLAVIAFWALGSGRRMFQAIIVANALLTVGLAVACARLLYSLVGVSDINAPALLEDIVVLAVVNVLAFSIWYWIIDPPGIDESQPTEAAWEFLFPQRAGPLPGYEGWTPRYTDYLHLAFTTSVAFSPTDTLPLTRRAKALMILQAAISLVSITFIAGTAIGILA